MFDAARPWATGRWWIVAGVAGLCLSLSASSAQDPPANGAAALLEAESLRARGQAADLRQAIDKYQAALSLFKSAADGNGQARTLQGMGRAYDSLSERRKAADCYLQELTILRAAGDRTRQAEALIFLALDYLQLGEGDHARDALTDALAAVQPSTDQRYRAVIFTHAGEVADQLGDKKPALEYFNQALSLHRAVGNRRGEATALAAMGNLYYSIGEGQKALEHLKPALELHRATNAVRDQGYTLATIGAVYYSVDDFPQSMSYLEQALPLLRQTGDKNSEAAVLHNLASCYERLGQLEEALTFYGKALAIHRQVGSRLGEATTISNIGRLHMGMGDFPAALDYYNRALPLHQASGNRGIEAATLNSLGAVYDAMGDRRKALDFYLRALPLRRAVSDRNGEADTLDRIARVYAANGDRQNTLDFANQALALRRASGGPRGEAASLATLALGHTLGNEFPEAQDLYRQALALYRGVGDRQGTASTLYRIASLDGKQNRLSEAHSEIEEALGIVEDLRMRVASPELRSSYFAAVREYFDLDIDLLMRLDREQPGKGFSSAAFETSERSRSRSLLDMLSQGSVDIREGVEPALLDRERELKRLLNAKADRQVELLRGKHTPQQLERVASDVLKLTDDYRVLQGEIRSKSPHYAALTNPQPLSLQDVQHEILDADTLLIQYSLGPERSYVWLVSRGSVTAYALPPRAEIDAAARRFYELVSAGGPASVAAGRTLSDMVVKPFASEIGSKRLAVVSDGALEYVPFAALAIPGSPLQKPLLADHEIVSLASCSALRSLRSETAGRQRAPNTIAVIADPVFRKEDSRVKGGAAPEPAAPLGNRLRTAELNLARLGGSRKEAESILALAPAARRREALDFDANLTAATGPEFAQYRIVHFATHAFLDAEHPELSGIVLSLVDRDGRPRDGILRLHEIYNLKWQADLVVLSACQTALGKEVRSEGFIGLTRGFMYAGAPRVAASLWKVDDEATAELMKSFYQAMLGPRGLPPAAALRLAQLKLAREKKWASPYYWAAFVLRGDWR